MPKLAPRSRTLAELETEVAAMSHDKLQEFALGILRAAHRYETVAVAVDAFIAAKVGKRLPKVDAKTPEFDFGA